MEPKVVESKSMDPGSPGPILEASPLEPRGPLRIRTVVDELMSQPPITVHLGAHLDEAWALMQEHHIRHLLVVDGEGLLAGVLSDRDIRAARASELLWKEPDKQQHFLRSYRVEDAVNRRPLRVASGSSVREALRIMRQTRVGCVPVTREGRPVGILTGRDILDLTLDLLDLADAVCA